MALIYDMKRFAESELNVRLDMLYNFWGRGRMNIVEEVDEADTMKGSVR